MKPRRAAAADDAGIARLRGMLASAMMVEHFTIPPYLCALYSIREGTNAEAAALIQTVVMEEMLHLVLVANLLNAVGGRARLHDPAFIPTYPAFLPHSARAFEVPLQRFSRQAIDTFMRIEKPAAHAAPQAEHFASIGDFYLAVHQLLKRLCARGGERRVFSGNPEHQVTPEYYYGGAGRLFVIHDLETAERAIREIVDQGEGAPGSVFDQDQEVRPARSLKSLVIEAIDGPGPDSPLERVRATTWSGDEEPAHYYRFQELYEGRYYQPGDTPRTGPRGPVFPLQWDAVYPMRHNPRAADYAPGSPIRLQLDEFNRCYTRFLLRLQQAFTGRPAALTAAVGEMYELKYRAIALMRTPSGDGATTVGPSFAFDPECAAP